MKLFVDAGNTRIKWQIREGELVRLSGVGVLESGGLFEEVSEELWSELHSVSVCTVRSEVSRVELEEFVARYTRAPVRFYWSQPAFGELKCAYSDPSAMGADRWYGLIGAWDSVKGACVVIDAGSAITIDWLDDRAAHQGGYILPGRKMMASSLRQSTDRVVFEGGDVNSETAPGHSTSECVFHGINWLTQAIAIQIGKATTVPLLVTGGDGVLIKEALDQAEGICGSRVCLCPDLVLDGLALAEAG